jgi:hypothetical protein
LAAEACRLDGMQASVEIHYAGVVVGRAEEMREVEGGELFIVTKEPLPVGTMVGVSTPEEQFNVRVARVVETVDGADNGMRVRRLVDGDLGANLWVPPPPAKPAPAPERVVAPVAEEQAPAQVAAEVPTPKVQATPSGPAQVETQSTPSEPASVAAAAPAAVVAAAPEPSAAPAEPEKAAADADAPDDDASAETAPADRKAEQMPLIADLPPARPTQGGNARRRTKRRK